MELSGRIERIREKFKYLSEEVVALRDGSFGYRLAFGLLLAVLLPVFVIELIILMLAGRDLGMFVQPKPVSVPVLLEQEVPESLRDLIPLARKFGVGDDAERGDILRAATPAELDGLEQRVQPRQQEIADWLDSFPEREISDTATFFLYLGSACDEAALYRPPPEA